MDFREWRSVPGLEVPGPTASLSASLHAKTVPSSLDEFKQHKDETLSALELPNTDIALREAVATLGYLELHIQQLRLGELLVDPRSPSTASPTPSEADVAEAEETKMDWILLLAGMNHNLCVDALLKSATDFREAAAVARRAVVVADQVALAAKMRLKRNRRAAQSTFQEYLNCLQGGKSQAQRDEARAAAWRMWQDHLNGVSGD